MATNYEFHKDKVLSWFNTGKCRGLLLADIKGVDEKEICVGRSCRECMDILAAFLAEEHIEAPKLTKRERAFCEAVRAGWIARNCNMHLTWNQEAPKLQNGYWVSCHTFSRIEYLVGDAFHFISDLDANPWSIEDLLKLEVMEELAQ